MFSGHPTEGGTVARQDRWGTGLEREGTKTGTSSPAPERSPADLEHTQPMERAEDHPDPSEETSYIYGPLPRVEQLPPGIIVKEDVMGRATGQWIVQIRCECGRRWFDVQMVKTARCPRCENMVVVDAID
jgi:hypothetical protein